MELMEAAVSRHGMHKTKLRLEMAAAATDIAQFVNGESTTECASAAFLMERAAFRRTR